MLSSFGKSIEKIQAQKGLSHGELAKLAGLSRQGLSRAKKSERPHITTIHKIAKALDAPVDIFLDGRV